jgi:hypothetical protein
MQNEKKLITTGVLLSIVFFIIGWITSSDFFWLTAPQVKGITYVDSSMTQVFFNLFVYSLTISLIPICCVVIWRKAPIVSIKRRILSVILILAFTTAGVFVGYDITFFRAKKLKASILKGITNDATMPVATENSMFLGLIVGSVTSYFLLRKKNNLLMKPYN